MADNWKNTIKERFSEYSAPEPEGLWDGIEKRMDARRSLGAWPWLAGAVAAGLAVLLVVGTPKRMLTGTDYVSRVEEAADSQELLEADDAPADNAARLDNTDVAAMNIDGHTSRSLARNAAKAQANVTDDKATTDNGQTVATDDMTIADSHQASTTDDKAIADSSQPYVTDDKVTTDSGQTSETDSSIGAGQRRPSSGSAAKSPEAGGRKASVPLDRIPMEPSSYKKARRLTASLYSASGQSTAFSSKGYGMHHTPMLASTKASAPKDDFSSLLALTAANAESTYDERHRQNLGFGVSIAYSYGDHWTFSTGVEYSRLVSEFNERSGLLRYSTTQTIEMIGIPLRAQYGWSPSKRLRLYGSAGFIAETPVKSESSTGTWLSDKYLYDSAKIQELKLPSVWWSAELGAGVEYRFLNKTGLYFEPSLRYHFQHAVPGAKFLYTSRPFSPGLTFGIRYTI